jgi:glycosyltransferase involved in cell wall biosynthesis
LNKSDLLEKGRSLLGGRLSNVIRNSVVDLNSFFGLIPPADLLHRPEGISAIVRVRNEEDWIEPSLLSIKDLVNEYVVVDGSTDRTPEIVDRLAKERGLELLHVMDFREDMVAISNEALALAKYRWVLRWDGDFVAKETMAKRIRETVGSCDRKKYFAVYWPHVCLDGDLWHQDPIDPLQFENWLVTSTPGSEFVRRRGSFEYLQVPSKYSKRLQIAEPLSFHLRTVKPPLRLLYHKYWIELFRNDLLDRVSLDTYASERIRQEYGEVTAAEAAKLFSVAMFSRLVAYDRERYGDYPRLLKDYAKSKLGIEL